MHQRNENNTLSLKKTRSRHSIAQRSDHVTLHEHVGPSSIAQQMLGNQTIARQASSFEETTEQDGQHERELADRISSLPAGLRKRIEQLAGMELDDIKVHYGSNKPMQLNAEAYAQGKDIYLAPGSEKHLPHEAWHIVQQGQGRVQPTMSIGNTVINDEQELEQEAKEMGEMATHLDGSNTADINSYKVQSQGALAESDTPVVQRASKSDNYSKSNDALMRAMYAKEIEKLVDNIVDKVEIARNRALQWQDFENESDNGYLKQWYDSAKAYVDNPNAFHLFLSARFGYAVEAIACDELGDSFGSFKLKYQVAHGHTRPDIVVEHNGMELGWIDITSIQSREHIFKKSGSGWGQKLFVYEVFYDELKANQLLEGSHNPYYKGYGRFVQEEHKIVAEEDQNIRTKWSSELKKFGVRSRLDRIGGGMKRREQLTREYFSRKTGISMKNTRHRRLALKGAIKHLGGSYTLYGYKKGKLNTDFIRSAIRNEGEKTIQERKKILNKDTNDSSSAFIKDYKMHPLAQEFLEADFTNRETVQKGLGLKSAFQIQKKLVEWKSNFEGNYDIISRIDSMLTTFPTALEVDALTRWINSVIKLVSELQGMTKIPS